MNQLADCDLSARLTAAEYDKRLAAAQRQLLKLRLTSAGLVKNSSVGPGFLIVMEGVDAGGEGLKGGGEGAGVGGGGGVGSGLW